MQLDPDARLLRIFIGEIDKYGHRPLYEALLQEARKENMAGCTVLKGILSFGASSIVHTAKLIDISQDLPIVVEVVDTDEKINNYREKISEMLEKAGCGALVTIEKATVLHYKHRKK